LSKVEKKSGNVIELPHELSGQSLLNNDSSYDKTRNMGSLANSREVENLNKQVEDLPI